MSSILTKTWQKMKVDGIKRCLLRNLSIIKAREITTKRIDSFEENRKPFITELRSDIHTKIVGTNYNYFEKAFLLSRRTINVLQEYPIKCITISLYDCIQRKGNIMLRNLFIQDKNIYYYCCKYQIV